LILRHLFGREDSVSNTYITYMYVGKREYETIPLTDHWVFLYALWYNLLLQLWTKSYANWHRILSTIWLWIYWFAWFFKDAKSILITVNH